jgi:Abnormal spindle-like microcephaly-assoc'd, ASPM-SPD-2-Hydin/NHL repeat
MRSGKSRIPLVSAILSVTLLVSAGALDNPQAHAQASSTPIPQLTPGLISTVAGQYSKGTGSFSGDGGPATSAEMDSPEGMALDSQGNLYIADTVNGVIRVVNEQTTAITILGQTIQPGDIQTVVGAYSGGIVYGFSFSGDGGPAGQAGLSDPTGLAFDSQGNLYIADFNNWRVRVVNFQSTAITVFGVTVQPGDIETVAGDFNGTVALNCPNSDSLGDGCPATQTALALPTSIAFDASGNLYIVDSGDFVVRKVNASTGTGSVAAGTGTSGFSGDGGSAVQAELFEPNWVSLDANGNVYIADLGSNRVRVVNTQSAAITLYGVTIQPGAIDTVAGSGTAIVNEPSTSAGYSGDGGPANQAHLNEPSGIWLDPAGDLYIADSSNNVIRKVNAQSGFITTVAGSYVAAGGYSGDGGPSTAAYLDTPYSVLLDPAGDLFIADTENEVIREVEANALVLNFPDTFPGSVSPDQPVTLQNIGGAAMTISKASLGGADASSFADKSTCTTSLAPGASCTFDLSFEPLASGAATASLSITESTPSASQSIALNGTGSSTIVAQITVSPTQLSFANQVVGAVSASQTVTVTNTGSAALAPSGAEAGMVTVIGLDAGDFTETNNCGSSLAAGASCTISVSFAPQAPGSSTAFLVVQGDGANTPVLVPLSGTGTTAAGATPANAPLLQVIPGTISTIAGDNVPGYTGNGGPATAAELEGPGGVSADASGNLYVSQLFNQVISYVNQQVAAVSPDGITVPAGGIQTIVGDAVGAGTEFGTYSGDGGPAIDAGLSEPGWSLLDSEGNLYFVDQYAYGSIAGAIRVVNTQPNAITVNGVSIPSYGIETVAGEGTVCADALDAAGDGCPASEAVFMTPGQIAMDAAGNLYIADTCHQVIRAINMGSSTTTIAGVSIAPGQIQIVAGTLYVNPPNSIGCSAGSFGGDGGPALSANFSEPIALAVDAQGNIYVGDSGNFRIRAINTQSTTQTILGVSIAPGAIETVVGNGTYGYSGDFGPATAAEIFGAIDNAAYSLALDPAGNLYLVDSFNNAIREIFASNGIIRTDAGNGYGAIQLHTVDGKLKGTYTGGYTGDGGAATAAELYEPNSVVMDAFGNLDIVDGANEVVRQVTPTPAAYTFPDTQVGTTSASEIYTFSNISTQSIAFSGITISPNFKQVPSGLTDCAATTTLPPAGICQLALAFAPSEVGFVTGSAVINDAAGVQTIELSGTGTAADGAVLQAITVSPANPPTIKPGSSQQFTATGDYSDGSTQTITSTVVWASSMTGIASFGATQGLATGVSPGTTQITAMMGNIVSSPVTLTVSAGSTLTSQTITVTTAAPASAADNSTFMVAATASSGLPVSIASSGACTGSGSGSATITMSAATGTCTVTYTQAGNSTYAAAPAVTSTTTAVNPIPTINSLSPSSATAGSAAFTLTVTGSNFVSGSVVNFGGTAEPVTFVSASQLTAAIPATAIASSGSVPVTVTNPAPGGGTSNSVAFTVNAAISSNPVPAIASILPTSAGAGSGAFTLTVNGTNFISGSVVNFNGSERTSTYVSATQLTAAILASDVASAGTVPVTVTNPSPGGGTSNSVSFTISAPLAPEASLSTASVNFPNTVVAATATTPVITLSNPGTAPLVITGITINGNDPSDFAETTTCTNSLQPGDSCNITVTFTPASAASFTATLSVSDNAANTPQAIALSGTGVPVPTFTLSSPTGAQTIQPGATAQYTINATAQNGTFAGSVTFAASGLPSGATATFNPDSVTPGNSSAATQLTIQTASQTASLSLRRGWPVAAFSLPLLLFLMDARRARRRWLRFVVILLVCMSAGAALNGCGAGFGTGSRTVPQTYTVTITGTSGSEQQTTTVQLTVQ